ncbi:hypothetical protein CK203_035994 [Vitis vinifera]|uniref:Uncharacterized protein n=1 Tax=Vitis vinifera TaxID=29760 RepID=A0A438HR48_VITVI|nr:hypothetical protein CK203_035994 [Vitis vinifera]
MEDHADILQVVLFFAHFPVNESGLEDKRKHFERKGANSRVKKTDELKMIHNLSKPLDLIHFPKPSKTLITKTHFSSSGPYGHVSPPILRFKSNSFLLYERTSLSIRASTISSSALTSPPEEDAESTQLFEVPRWSGELECGHYKMPNFRVLKFWVFGTWTNRKLGSDFGWVADFGNRNNSS